MKYLFYLLTILLFSLSSCKLLETSVKTVKPTKEFIFSIVTSVPDQEFSLSEAKSEAVFIASKANSINQVKFKIVRVADTTELIFTNQVSKSLKPINVKASENGFKIDFKFAHSKENLEKLDMVKINRVSGSGITFREAFKDAFRKAVELKSNRKEYNISGNMTLVNIEKLIYKLDKVEVTLDFIVNIKEISAITKVDIANSYGAKAIKSLQKKDVVKAEEFIKKGLSISEQCDRCYYASAINGKRLKSWNFSIGEIQKAISINKTEIKYYQFLQSMYIFLYDNVGDDSPEKIKLKADLKKKAWKNEGYMKKHFNEDGTVIEKEKAPISTEKPKFTKPKMETETLDNKLKITKIKKDDLPLFQISIGFNFGTSHNPEGKMGLIKTMFSLISEGVEGMTSKEIAKYIDNNGLYLWFNVSGDYSTLNCASLSENSDKCIFLLDKLINTASFPVDEFKKYMKRTIETYSLKSSQPSYLASKLLYRLVYNKHPYMYYDATLKTLNNITLADVYEFYNKYVNPLSAYVIVSGSYDDKTIKNLEDKFSNWRKGKNQVKMGTFADSVKPLKLNRDIIYLIHRKDSAQATVKYAQTTIPFSDNEFINLHIANQAFGGGATGRLFMRLREKESLTYGAYSGLSEKLQKGIFVISTDVRNEVVGQAVNSILDELTKLKEKGITAKELERVKSYEIGKLSLKLEKLSAFNDEMMKKHFFNLKDSNEIEEIEDAKLEDINKTVNRVITPNKGIIVIVGDYYKLIDQLKKIGIVAVFDTNFKPINLEK